MLNVIRIEESQLEGHADTVIGTERSALGMEPFAVDIGLDGILEEVEVNVHQFVTDHVHMTLEHDRRHLLHAFRRRLGDKHIAGFVDLYGKPSFFCKLL